jgi:hypothetical protein
MLSEPCVILCLSLECHPPETGGSDLDQPTLLKGTQPLQIITIPSQDFDVKETERGQIRKDGTTARRARFPTFESLAAQPSGHGRIVYRVLSRRHAIGTGSSRKQGTFNSF